MTFEQTKFIACQLRQTNYVNYYTNKLYKNRNKMDKEIKFYFRTE